MTSYFFYGLFMNRTQLQVDGFHPSPALPAKLSDYELYIGQRATIIPQISKIVYGMLMELPHGEAEALYCAPSLSDYQPQLVNTLRLSDDKEHQAVCYTIPLSAVSQSRNQAYAQELSSLLLSLGFPKSYASQIVRTSKQ